jgi:hypothetical protein
MEVIVGDKASLKPDDDRRVELVESSCGVPPLEDDT